MLYIRPLFTTAVRLAQDFIKRLRNERATCTTFVLAFGFFTSPVFYMNNEQNEHQIIIYLMFVFRITNAVGSEERSKELSEVNRYGISGSGRNATKIRCFLNLTLSDKNGG